MIIPEEEPKKYQPAPEETVAGTMEGLLSSGSSYLEAAKTRGKQFAAKSGLLNTTMAAGASEAEAIKSALPIAQQDAGYMQNRGLEAQKGEIQTGLYKTQGEISGGLLAQEGEQAKELSAQESEQTFGRETALATQKGTIQSELTAQEAREKAALSAQESTQAITLENIQQEGANYRLSLENELELRMADMELSSQEKTSVGNAMAELGNLFTEQLANIQRDTSFSSKNKTEIIKTLQAAYQSNLETLANIYSISISWQPVVSETNPLTDSIETNSWTDSIETKKDPLTDSIETKWSAARAAARAARDAAPLTDSIETNHLKDRVSWKVKD